MKILILLFLCLWLLPSYGQVDFNEIKVQLITVGAGENYWESFGHSALRIKTGNVDYLYGFGYFNFADEDFFLKFAKGQMRYYLGIEETDQELDNYKYHGREIWAQDINLNPSKKNKLIKKLNFLAQEKNRYYNYDYFLNNCTSQIRDILDEVTEGDITKQLKKNIQSSSWFDATFPVTNQTWMNLAFAIGYGLPAYRDRNQWYLSVFPEDFANNLAKLETKTNWNSALVKINQPNLQQLITYSFIKTHYANILSVVVLLLGIIFKLTRKFTINFWLITQSLVAIGLFLLWFFTKHSVAAYNINLLLFFPLNILLIFQRFRTRRYLNIFLILNLAWLLVALTTTNVYLIGFFVVNLIIYILLFKQTKRHFF